MGEALHIYGLFFMHLNLFLTEKMQSDRKFRRHVNIYIIKIIILLLLLLKCHKVVTR